MDNNAYSFIQGEKSSFKKPIILVEGWNFSWITHIRRSVLYKNSQFEEANDNRETRPFKNIVRPILNVQYRTEGFDVKDIEIYVNDPQNYYKSFLVKKFHEKWALQHEMDTFIDEVVESYVDFGGVLVKNVDDIRPEVVNLQSIAFCDQTDFLSGPFAIEHFLSPGQLRDMKKRGWGDKKNGATIDIEKLIAVSLPSKDKDTTQISTPGKYIKVYELHGTFPASWLKENKEEEYVPQIQIVAFYQGSDDKEVGATLFKSKEPKLPFKFLKRDPIFGRALGFGGIEELFEPQIWTNFSEIKIAEMLEHASKVIYTTTDPAYKNRNRIKDMSMGEITTVQEGRQITQLDTTPRNLPIFNDAVTRWQDNARLMGSAAEALIGESPSAGTPFKLFEAQLMEGKSLHHWRQGKLAVFMDEIYRDWIIPYISREITKGQKFLAELSADELQEVAEKVAAKEANRQAVEKILNGELVMPGEMEATRQTVMEGFLKGGTKKFIEILKDEMKDAPLEVRTSIAGKQKNLALLTDKLVNVLRQFISTPEIRQDPDMVKLLNTILESSGMSPIMFGPSSASAIRGGGGTEPLKALAKTTQKAAPALTR